MIKSVLAFMILLAAGYMVYNNLRVKRRMTRKQLLEALASHFNATLEPLEGVPDSHRICFTFEHHSFIYEDICEGAVDSEDYSGFLKAALPFSFRMDFVERSKEYTFEYTASFDEMSIEHLGKGKKVVLLPDSLREFSVLTNDPVTARSLLDDSRSIRVLQSFKNKDHVGRPVMSLDLNGEFVVLKFHPPGMLSPCWEELQQDPGAMNHYLDQLIVVLDFLKARENNP